MAWNNPNGPYTKYGTEKTVVGKGGEYRNNGALREIELKIDLTTLTDTAAIMSDTIYFPETVRIEEVEVVTQTAATGAGATLDIGLIATDRTTEIDFEAFVKAGALTSYDAAGEKTVYRVGSTGAGDLIGTTIANTAAGTNVGHITANYNTAAYTAGVIYVRIRYYTP